jgi:uncharacterized protein (DUF2141 family)
MKLAVVSRVAPLVAAALLAVAVRGVVDISARAAASGSLVVRVTGIPSDNASVRMAVFDSAQVWLDEPSAVYRTVLDGNEREWRIERVPQGEYAVAVFHDENRDGKLNRGIFGIPQEKYGFSNDARGVFGPANWREARFTVGPGSTEISIEVR